MSTPFRQKNILQNFKAVLDASSTFSECTIGVGEDARNPYGNEDAPFILLLPGEHQRGQSVSEFQPTIRIIFAVRDERIENNVYLGVYAADDRAEEIFNEIHGNSDFTLDQENYSIDTVSEYPVFYGGLEVTINQPNTIGA